jgi:hypothetical protein
MGDSLALNNMSSFSWRVNAFTRKTPSPLTGFSSFALRQNYAYNMFKNRYHQIASVPYEAHACGLPTFLLSIINSEQI